MSPGRKILNAVLLLMLSPFAAYAQTSGITFIPEVVFAGRSQGKGELRLLLGEPRPFTVQSLGARQGDGSFRLDQEVRFEDKPVESRFWVIKPIGADSYAGTLSDAAGPVVGHINGRRMTLTYPLTSWGLSMEQTMDLAEDGRSVVNCGVIRFLGIPIGELQETIRLIDVRS